MLSNFTMECFRGKQDPQKELQALLCYYYPSYVAQKNALQGNVIQFAQFAQFILSSWEI